MRVPTTTLTTTLLRPLGTRLPIRTIITGISTPPDVTHDPTKHTQPGVPHFAFLKEWDPVAQKSVKHADLAHPSADVGGGNVTTGRAATAAQVMADAAQSALGEDAEIVKMSMRKEHGVEVAEVMVDGGDGCGYAGVVIRD
ncbi:hypothetical protein HK097_000102, partial [Rhizophlyctis rosea]